MRLVVGRTGKSKGVVRRVGAKGHAKITGSHAHLHASRQCAPVLPDRIFSYHLTSQRRRPSLSDL